MKTSHRRIALLTGASLSALGLAMPAQAQMFPHPDSPQVDNTDPANPTLVICNLATDEDDPDCFFGMIDVDPVTADARVNSTASGRIQQSAAPLTGNVVATITNDGDAEIGALAQAGGTAAVAADAYANVVRAIDQRGTAPGDVTLLIDNNGDLLIDAVAVATGADADAHADVTTAIYQSGISTGDGDVLVTISNDGNLDIIASADANGETNATASAHFNNVAILQAASALGAGNASAVLDNNGALTIAALADADVTGAGDAFASASVSGIWQTVDAQGGGDALAQYTNDSTYNISAIAIANAADGNATAEAAGRGLIFQTVTADAGGDAAAVHVNNGTEMMTISAIANAVGGAASASADAGTPIWQEVASFGGGLASASLTNEGTIGVLVNADADGASANASASLSTAIAQSVEAWEAGTPLAGGDAIATLNNLGTITLAAIADAGATAGPATASATASNVVWQDVYSAGGNASASLTNGGTMTIAATATAIAKPTAEATEDAVAGPAVATASVSNAIQQEVESDGGDATATLDNSGALTISAAALASGTETSFITGTGTAATTVVNPVYAGAFISDAISQDVVANGGGDAFATLTNSGSILISATATAIGDVTAEAMILGGIRQQAFAGGTTEGGIILEGGIGLAFVTSTAADAFVGLTNTGSITMIASAFASNAAAGPATASAVISSAIVQSASATGNAGASLINEGSIAINAIAHAVAVDSAFANALVSEAIVQDVNGGGTGSAFISNSGTMTIAASASAVATGIAIATADVGGLTGTAPAAINQSVTAGDTAVAILTNSGSVLINANAAASASTLAWASANAFGVHQSVGAGDVAAASISNSGTMTVAATAVAAAASTAIASARAFGASQSAAAGTTASVSVDNSGSLSISAFASASATFLAFANASAAGVVQNADGGTASFVNGGTFSVIASAAAFALTTEGTPTGTGFAHANAVGLIQNADVASLANSGSFSVIADAFTSGYSGTAAANALGYQRTGTTLTLDVTNSGDFNVNANAHAVSSAFAHAVGMSFEAAATGTVTTGTATVPATTAALIDGTIVNSGSINVVADASATFFTSLASAMATGILMTSGVNTATITNSGSLTVDAIVNGPDGTATANGIVVVGNGTGLPPVLVDDPLTPEDDRDILTINNSGDIIVRESVDGGASFTRGMAIDVALAPNNTVINLLGGGNIYGNIDVQDGDVINVDNGETSFDGIINPECMPPVLDGASSACGQGTLNITADGALFLRYDPTRTDDMFDGPAYAFVETFNMVPGATLIYELETNIGGTQPVGTYPQIFADVANIDGNLVVRPITSNGLFETSFWNNVIDANVRNGTFDTCTIEGFEDSVLLDITCIYDALANVDLGIQRTAFDAVPGLTRNQAAVGSGLECIFDPDMTGGLADVLADLFTFDANEFPEALDQLTGAAYASYLNSFNSLGVHYNDVLANATDCEIPALAGSVLECRTAPTHVWGQVDFQNRRTDRDVEAAGYDADRWTALIGFDMNVGSQAIVGVSIGKVTNRVDVSRFGDQIKATGHQLGAYGVLDPGPFYVKAMGTYNWFDGDGERNIDFGPLGGLSEGQLHGDADVKMWTLGLHGGYRMAMGATSTLTPYLNLDYTNVRMGGFTEVGMGDVGLTIEDAKEKRTTLTGGVKYAAMLMGGVAEAELGYRYQFGDRRSNFTAHFLGDEACEFDIISAAEKRGEILAGLSFGGKAGPVDVRVGYQGLFSGTSKSHAGNFKLVLPLGGRAEPPPPEYVAPPPPPPPPPPPEYVPPPPPPPPPPAPSGERG